MSANTSIYRRVLIPIDLTPGSLALAPAVRRIVDTRDTEITLLHVVEPKPWLGRAAHTLRLMNELEILAQRQSGASNGGGRPIASWACCATEARMLC